MKKSTVGFVAAVAMAGAIVATVLLNTGPKLPPNFIFTMYYTEWSLCDMQPQDLDWGVFPPGRGQIILFCTEPTNSPPYSRIGPDSSLWYTGWSSPGGAGGWCANRTGRSHLSVLIDSAKAHGVRILLGVGGEWGGNASTMSSVIEDSAKGAQMLEANAGWIERNIIAKGVQSGLEFDHEYPNSRGPLQRAKYTAFYKRVHDRLAKTGSKLIITAGQWCYWDANSSGDKNPVYDPQMVRDYVDQFQVMLYQMQRGGAADHFAPLNGGTSPKMYSWTDSHAYPEFIRAGFPREKLVPVMSAEHYEINASNLGSFGGGGTTGWSLKNIPQSAFDSMKYDAARQAAYMIYAGKFYSVESKTSIDAKIQMAIDSGAAGFCLYDPWRAYFPNTNNFFGKRDPYIQWLKSWVSDSIYAPPPVDTTHVPPIDTTKPPLICLSPVQLQAKYDSVWAAKICSSGIDTTGYWATRFNQGWNAAIDAMPSSVTGTATLVVTKPAKKP